KRHRIAHVRLAGIRTIIRPLISRRHRHHLRRPQHLPESLVLHEIETALPAVINMRHKHRSAIREPKLISPEWRNPPRIGGRWMIEIVPRIKRRVPHELEK